MDFNKLLPELTVSDFEKSLNFYTDMIGFKAEYERQSPRFAFLSLEGSQIMIQEQGPKDKWDDGELKHPYGRGINFQIDITDVNKIYDSLKKNNYPVFQQIEDHFYKENEIVHHERELLVQDPDGYLLRFSQYIESK